MLTKEALSCMFHFYTVNTLNNNSLRHQCSKQMLRREKKGKLNDKG